MSSSRVARLSSNNPFRTPAVTPNPTGASVTSSSAPSYATLPPIATSSAGGSSASIPPPNYSDISEIGPPSDDEESPELLPELTPRILSPRPPSNGPPPSLPPRNDSQSRPSSTASLSSRASNPPPPSNTPPSLSVDSFPEAVPPPAYSLSPDVGGGELLVQQGPRRPFQRAPEPFLQFPAPEIQEPEQQSQSSRRQPPQFAPPPVPPLGRAPPSPSSERPRSQLSAFAQDFYNAGPTTPSDEQQRQPRYAPPPGAPPPRPRAASTSSGAGSTAPPTSDGRPTTTPTPGHPLLRNGQTLVYPENYSCPKCTPSCCVPYYLLTYLLRFPIRKGHNTGYKNYDPSHPCRKCWDRFSKTFTSILASSPWGGEASASATQSQRGRSFQRPLPAFRPPQARAPPPPPIPGAYPSPTGPPLGMQRCNSRARAMPFGTVPPPGATVVMPGDPRIGGRLCWRCGGRGTTPFLIFDELTCETCGGIGRLIN